MGIREIKSKIKRLERELSKAREERDDLEIKKELPNLNKKYCGKYFRYKNSYSCPEPGEFWWLYIRVDKINSKDDIKTFSFQTCIYNKITIKPDGSSTVEILTSAEEITSEVFYLAYDLMIKEIENCHSRIKQPVILQL